MRNQYINLQYSKYWLSSPSTLRLLAPNNYNIVANWMRDRNGAAIKKAYIYQNDRLIDRVCNLEYFTTAKAEWTEADTIAKRKQDEYVKATREFVKTNRKNIMGVEFMQVSETVAKADKVEDYIVTPYQLEKEPAEHYNLTEFEEEYNAESVRQKALSF